MRSSFLARVRTPSVLRLGKGPLFSDNIIAKSESQNPESDALMHFEVQQKAEPSSYFHIYDACKEPKSLKETEAERKALEV